MRPVPPSYGPGVIWQERNPLLRRRLFTRVRSVPATI